MNSPALEVENVLTWANSRSKNLFVNVDFLPKNEFSSCANSTIRLVFKSGNYSTSNICTRATRLHRFWHRTTPNGLVNKRRLHPTNGSSKHVNSKFAELCLPRFFPQKTTPHTCMLPECNNVHSRCRLNID